MVGQEVEGQELFPTPVPESDVGVPVWVGPRAESRDLLTLGRHEKRPDFGVSRTSFPRVGKNHGGFRVRRRSPHLWGGVDTDTVWTVPPCVSTLDRSGQLPVSFD